MANLVNVPITETIEVLDPPSGISVIGGSNWLSKYNSFAGMGILDSILRFPDPSIYDNPTARGPVVIDPTEDFSLHKIPKLSDNPKQMYDFYAPLILDATEIQNMITIMQNQAIAVDAANVSVPGYVPVTSFYSQSTALIARWCWAGLSLDGVTNFNGMIIPYTTNPGTNQPANYGTQPSFNSQILPTTPYQPITQLGYPKKLAKTVKWTVTYNYPASEGGTGYVFQITSSTGDHSYFNNSRYLCVTGVGFRAFSTYLYVIPLNGTDYFHGTLAQSAGQDTTVVYYGFVEDQ